MSVCVFIGPTISVEDAGEFLPATYLPPVRQGDVYRVVSQLRPLAIGIVDGYFQHVPSVWHKEILWAMDRGVHVFGSASMGALRAAELAPFGMRGVGTIFSAYADGILPPYQSDAFEDDDEVAVLHGPAETGYIAVSEAMVNIRCTLAAACREAVIDISTRDALVGAAKQTFFGERHYEGLLAAASALPADEVERLRAWLPQGRINQKRVDSIAMLGEMRDFLANQPEPARLDARFESTEMWQRGVDASPWADDGGGDTVDSAVLDELRLNPDAYVQVRRSALLRMLAGRAAEQRGIEPERTELQSIADVFRHDAALLNRAAIDTWLEENRTDLAGFDQLMRDEACVARMEKQVEPELGRYILDHLRLTGGYSHLASRVRSKRVNLDRQTPDAQAPDGMGSAGIDQLMLLDWYFQRCLNRAMPADVAAYAASLGFGDEDAFLRALRAEYAFSETK